MTDGPTDTVPRRYPPHPHRRGCAGQANPSLDNIRLELASLYLAAASPDVAAVKRLAAQTGRDEERCRTQLQAMLMMMSRPASERGGVGERAFLAFKLHRFISGAGHAYATLRGPSQRRVTLDGQHFDPGNPDARLYATFVCRNCGQEHHPVVLVEDGGVTRVLPRPIDETPLDDTDGGEQAGYLMPEPEGDADMRSPVPWRIIQRTGSRPARGASCGFGATGAVLGRGKSPWIPAEQSRPPDVERGSCLASSASAPRARDDEALLEFLASQRGQKPVNALHWLAAAEAQLGDKAALPYIADIAGDLRLQKETVPLIASQPWQLAYRLAEECRAMVDLEPERVFDDVDDVAALFSGTGFKVAEGRVPGLRAEAYRGDGAPKIIVAGLPVPQSRTFAMMRAIGDFLAFQQEGRSPVTDTYSYRQAVGRAFAVEMLAPAETILQMEQEGMTSDEIAGARNVSKLAISWHLENNRAQRT